MLYESLVNGHLLISLYIINNGFPLKNKNYPSPMHAALEVVEDYLGVAIVNLLSQHGCDVNRQVLYCMKNHIVLIMFLCFDVG